MSWDPDQYLKFADHRLRPALDLVNAIPLTAPHLVCDLGCGAGNVTRLLRLRWPDARLIGVDTSAEMLSKAAGVLPDALWQQADLADWAPPEPSDLIFSNAALQWLPDHPALFRRLVAQLAPDGVLAVQMPRNYDTPSHTGMRDAAEAGPWRDLLRPLLRHAPVATAADYWAMLADLGVTADIWLTEYLHVLSGDDPVVQWTLGTALRPLVAALDEPWRGAFLADYTVRMRAAYPTRADGTTLFPFRRLFILARKG
jgi:trans-aconitate 2-methyltransferase